MDDAKYFREDSANAPLFDEYLRVSEPHTRERVSAWKTAIGLQAVDGLCVSEYLKETAQRHIEGKISIDEVQNLVRTYYNTRTARLPDEAEKQEADKVSVNIAQFLSEKSFSLSVPGFLATHRRIFSGVFEHAGTLRPYDITKKEWVLQGDTVLYVAWDELERTLEYDIAQEARFSYAGLNITETIAHIAKFISGLWQIHPFREGNTRTTAIFAIKYLRSIGFDAGNSLFEKHSWYFRNALVRANYRNVKKGIAPNLDFLIRFFRNLLLGEMNQLSNRYLLVNAPAEWGTPIIDPASTPTTSPASTPTTYPTSRAKRTSKRASSGSRSPASTPTSTPASSSVATTSPPTSCGNAWCNVNETVHRLVFALGENQFSVKELMREVGLKDRKNFLEYTLNPALKAGVVALLYPDKPKHPRQKYRLTVKGLALFNEKRD